MQTGTKISAALHLGLLGWAFLGGAFRSEPLPFEVQEVTVISAEEFAAMTGVSPAPDIAEDTAALGQPEPDPVPETPAIPEPAPEPAQPEAAPVPVPEPDPVPEPVAEPAPRPPEPEPEIAETPVQPDPEPDPVPEAVLITQSPRPKPRPVDRVAPEPVAAPPPDAAPEVETTPAVVPDDGAETPQTQQDATAQEEASDQTVTEAEEAEETAAAPTQSVRPKGRPTRPEAPTAEPVAQADPQTETGETVETETSADTPAEAASDAPDTTAAVNAALAEALLGDSGDGGASDAPSGPPLTADEEGALKKAVQVCWNLGTASTEALSTTIVVRFEMTPDGKPVPDSLRLVSSEGGSEASANVVYRAARSAIIRCTANANLPPEKYEHWRDIEMTFNPERMRNR